LAGKEEAAEARLLKTNLPRESMNTVSGCCGAWIENFTAPATIHVTKIIYFFCFNAFQYRDQ
jgi:hypothetical protein